MGIEGFLKRIKDAGLGTQRVLGRTGDEIHTQAIIDGPSLAHHIYNTLSEKEVGDHNIAPNITYRAIAASVIDWIGKLQTHGLQVEAIFFDGALPASKKEVRVQRLTNYAQKLILFQQAYDDQYRKITRGHLPTSYWDNSRMNKARRETPPPAFLVAVVIEALLSSRYADLCFVVPDEADRYCVAAARQVSAMACGVGVSIWTNDSDLVVFDTGAQTTVVMFNDLVETAQRAGQGSVISGTEYKRRDILQKYQLFGLLEVAFLLKINRATTFAEAARSKNNALGHAGFAAFAREYQLENQHLQYQVLCTDSSQRMLANGLDARLSEMVYQLKGKEGLPSDEIDMYLPFLLEDPRKASAWHIGTHWRTVAYKVLCIAQECASASIQEYKRHASRVAGTKVSLSDSADVDDALLHAQQWLNSALVKGERGPHTEVERWRFLIMELTVQDMQQQAITVTPTLEDITTVLMGRPTSRWDVSHLSARYQAMYYSMRLCWQALRYVKGINGAGHSPRRAVDDSESGFGLLLFTLHSLPGIADFFEPVFDISRTVYAAEWNGVGEAYQATYSKHYAQHEEETPQVESVTLASSSDNTSMDYGSSEDEGEGGSLAGNPFAALASK